MTGRSSLSSVKSRRSILSVFLGVIFVMESFMGNPVLASDSTSNNMSLFIDSVSISPTQDDKVYAGTEYTFTLNLKENDDIQFADELSMTIPDAVSGFDYVGHTDINVNIGGVTYVVSDNTYSVDASSNTITFQFNTEDLNYNYLVSAENATASVSFTARIDENIDKIEWNSEITTAVVSTPELGLSKTGWVSKSFYSDSNFTYPEELTYNLTLNIYGDQKNVNLTDALDGTALSIVEGSVSITPNVEGADIKYPDEGGFTIDFPEIDAGSYIISYRADFDITEVEDSGTDSETNNTAVVTNEDYDISANGSFSLTGQIKKSFIDKNCEYDEDNMTAAYVIALYGDVIGHDIHDVLDQNASNQSYSGEGITVEYYDYDNEAWEILENVSWDRLGVGADDKSWNYTVPEYGNSDDTRDNCKITISYTVDVTYEGKSGKFDISNTATDINTGNSDTAGATGIGIESEWGITKMADKNMLGENDDSITWTITIDVPAGGLPDAVLTDSIPQADWNIYGTFSDTDGNYSVTGLVQGETYEKQVIMGGYDSSFISVASGVKFMFTYTDDMGVTHNGLMPTDSDRQIIVTLTTGIAENWPLYTPHTNIAELNTSLGRKSDEALVLPYADIDIDKQYVDRIETVGGDIYYCYEVVVSGFVGDIEIVDTYSEYQSFPSDMEQRVLEDGVSIEALRETYETTPWLSSAYPTFEEYLIFNSHEVDLTPVFKVKSATGDYFISDASGRVDYDDNGSGVIFDISEDQIPKDYNNNYYDSSDYNYTLIYWLKTDEQRAYYDSSLIDGPVHISNTAVYNGERDTSTVDIQFDALSKTARLTDRESEVEFSISVNPEGRDMSSGDYLTITDTFSDNFNLSLNTIDAVDSDGLSIDIRYEISGNTITYVVPDGKALTITYRGLVAGAETQVVSNRATLFGYTAIATQTVTRSSSASGTASNIALTLYKYDLSDSSQGIPGAVFELYSVTGDNENKLKEFITGTDGNVTIMGNREVDGFVLQSGVKYYLKETYVPDGYILDDDLIYFEIADGYSADNMSVFIDGSTLAVGNARRGTAVCEHDIATINKIGVNETPLEGAEFTLYADSDLTEVIAVLESDPNGRITISTDESYLEDYLPVDGSSVRYYLKETKAPEGYLINDTVFRFEIISDISGEWNDTHTEYSSIIKYTVLLNGQNALTVTDNEFEHEVINVHDSITLNKIDPSNDPVAGAEFTLYADSNLSDVIAVLPASDSNGKITVSTQDSYIEEYLPSTGSVTYYLKETAAPIGYIVNNSVYQVDINVTITSRIDNDQQLIFDTIKYSITVDGGESEDITDDIETISIEITKTWADDNNRDGIRPESITVNVKNNEETVRTVSLIGNSVIVDNLPKYDKNGNEIEYTIEEQRVTGYESEISGFDITNTHTVERTSFTVTKVWEDDGNASDIRPEEISVSLIRTDADNEGGIVIDTVTLSEENNWSYTWSELLKNYKGEAIEYSSEENVPDGYSVNIRNTEAGNILVNTIEYYELEFYKYGPVTEMGDNNRQMYPLEGARFAIYRKDCPDEALAEAVSDVTGRVVFENLAYGDYIINEIESPEGYELDTTDYSVFVNSNSSVIKNENGETLEGNIIVNELITGEIRIRKVNEQHQGQALSGSRYGLYRMARTMYMSTPESAAPEDMILIDTSVTDENGYINFEGVMTGVEYTIKELEAPDGYYISDNPILIVLGVARDGKAYLKSINDGDGTVYADSDGNITWLEPEVVVKISKTDGEGNALSGAVLAIKDSEGNIVVQWTSTEDAYVLEGVLLSGQTYTLTELEAPQGYKLAPDITFTTDGTAGPDENKVIELTMADQKIAITASAVPSTGETEKYPAGSIVLMAGAIVFAISWTKRREEEC